jgi:hypothetical protein
MGNVEARERRSGGLSEEENPSLFSGAFDCCQSGKVLFVAPPGEDSCVSETHLTRGACIDRRRRIER